MDGCVNQYSAAFKARVRRRLVGPQAVSANRLSSDVGVSAELGALLRREGLHAAPLTEWRAAAEAALGPPARTARTEDGARIHALEREVRRNDRALAESAALRVLKKNVQEIWGDADDTTDPRSAR